MQEKIFYQANDGKIFETKDDCIVHESKIKFKNDLMSFFGNITSIPIDDLIDSLVPTKNIHSKFDTRIQSMFLSFIQNINEVVMKNGTQQ